jgi:tetratricopeptide (TPR) repeat protein
VSVAVVIAIGVSWWVSQQQVRPGLELDLSGTVREVREAIQVARGRVEADPLSGESWGELAMLLRAHGFELPADSAFRRAEELDGDEFRWPYLLGLSLENVEPVEAERCLRRAIELARSNPLPKLSLAEMLAEAGRTDEARVLFQEASDLESGNARVLLGLARLKLGAGELAAAEVLCRQVEAIDPDQRMVQELLARILYGQGRRDEAERVRRRLERMPLVETSDDPFVAEVLLLRRDPNWIAERAQAMLEQGQTGRAVKYLETVMSEHPDRLRFPLQLARALGAAGQAERAGEVLKRAVADFPDSADLRLELGLMLEELGDEVGAIASFQAAIERKPDSAEAWLWQGRVLRDRKDPKQAARCFRQAIRFRPDLPEAHAALGKLLLAGGLKEDVAEAVSELETAVDLAPGNLEWRSRLAEARRRVGI